MGIDKEGNMVGLTYEVSVYCQGKMVILLGAGSSDVFYFYDLVKDGKIDTLEVEYSHAFNVDVTLSGQAFLNMIKKFYPDKLTKIEDNIVLTEKYVIHCYDFS